MAGEAALAGVGSALEAGVELFALDGDAAFPAAGVAAFGVFAGVTLFAAGAGVAGFGVLAGVFVGTFAAGVALPADFGLAVFLDGDAALAGVALVGEA